MLYCLLVVLLSISLTANVIEYLFNIFLTRFCNYFVCISKECVIFSFLGAVFMCLLSHFVNHIVQNFYIPIRLNFCILGLLDGSREMLKSSVVVMDLLCSPFSVYILESVWLGNINLELFHVSDELKLLPLLILVIFGDTFFFEVYFYC